MRKRSILTKIFCFLVIFLFVSVSGFLIIIKRVIFDSVAQTVAISNVTQPWQHNFSHLKGNPLLGNLRIEIRGNLDGAAHIYCAGIPIDLTSGNVDTYIYEDEYWGNSCDVRYEPIGVTTGKLSIRAMVGMNYRRPVLDDQGPANYTGDWDTYYPNSNKKYCTGFYRHGKKDGNWAYFDQKGQTVRVEVWKEGKQM